MISFVSILASGDSLSVSALDFLGDGVRFAGDFDRLRFPVIFLSFKFYFNVVVTGTRRATTSWARTEGALVGFLMHASPS